MHTHSEEGKKKGDGKGALAPVVGEGLLDLKPI